MPIQITEKTRETLCKTLGVGSLSELMNRDFKDISADADVSRTKAALYADRNRGSVRLNAGRFYTTREYTDRVRKMKAIKLP
jgi:hypothetical protein